MSDNEMKSTEPDTGTVELDTKYWRAVFKIDGRQIVPASTTVRIPVELWECGSA